MYSRGHACMHTQTHTPFGYIICVVSLEKTQEKKSIAEQVAGGSSVNDGH